MRVKCLFTNETSCCSKRPYHLCHLVNEVEKPNDVYSLYFSEGRDMSLPPEKKLPLSLKDQDLHLIHGSSVPP